MDGKSTARRLYGLVEPVHLVTYFADEPTAALMALGLWMESALAAGVSAIIAG